jgi:hypothetical protein
MFHKKLSWAIAAIVVVLIPRAGHTDCASGADYRATVTGNTVTVCPVQTTRTCSATTTLFRQDASDGTTVAVTGACSSQGCYVDACVPAGNYRYGYATPFDCSEAGCGAVALFVNVSVTNVLAADCAPPGGSATTAPAATSAPWGSGAGDAGFSRLKSCPSGGCAMASADRTAVRLVDLLAIGLGILLVGRQARCARARRPRRSP